MSFYYIITGTNKIDKMKLKINEIFFSIQGEGLDMGRPCIMIRLSGCNLRCSYCDTRYAFEEGKILSIDQICKEINQYDTKIVEITGGEPLYQENTTALIAELIKRGYKTLVETNGSLDISKLPSESVKIMDIKLPSSGMEKSNLYSNIEKLKNNDQLKFVVSTEDDFIFAREILKVHNIHISFGNIIFSPVFNKLSPAKLADWIKNIGIDVRMQVQLHKIIWPENMRGV